MRRTTDPIDIDSGPRPLNAEILVAMGTSFMLGLLFCLFVYETRHERSSGIICGLGLVTLFFFSVVRRTKLIFAATREIFAKSPQAPEIQ